MSAKDETIENKQEETKELEPFKYGVAPSLMINIVREERVYRFEMPIGAKLTECEEACNECLKVVKKMQEEAEQKLKEEKEKKEKEESESSDEENKKEDNS
jgi:hypothetical protein